MELIGIEPTTSGLQSAALSQLSYSPSHPPAQSGNKVGLGRVELPTSPLSGVRSNQLSYRPAQFAGLSKLESRYAEGHSILTQ